MNPVKDVMAFTSSGFAAKALLYAAHIPDMLKLCACKNYGEQRAVLECYSRVTKKGGPQSIR